MNIRYVRFTQAVSEDMGEGRPRFEAGIGDVLAMSNSRAKHHVIRGRAEYVSAPLQDDQPAKAAEGAPGAPDEKEDGADGAGDTDESAPVSTQAEFIEGLSDPDIHTVDVPPPPEDGRPAARKSARKK